MTADDVNKKNQMMAKKALLSLMIPFIAILALLKALTPIVDRISADKYGGTFSKRIPELGEKYYYFAENRDRYDGIFLGASVTNEGVVPQEFDSVVRTRIASFQTFNFGLSSGTPPEFYRILAELIALKPARLKWVFVDLTYGGEWEKNIGSARFDAIYNWDMVLADGKSILAALPTPGFWSELERLRLPFWGLVRLIVSPGRSAEWFDYQFNLSERTVSNIESSQGYSGNVFQEHDPGFEAIWQRFQSRRGGKRQTRQFNESMKSMLLSLQSLAKQNGLQLLFYISPGRNSFEPSVSRDEFKPLLDFDQGEPFEELFRFEYRMNMGHFNYLGAKKFSRRFAIDFLKTQE